MDNKNIFVFICFLFLISACNKNSDPVTNENNPPTTGWVLDYRDYNIGSFFCNTQNPCFFDIITDTVDLTKSDSMRIYMSYQSFRGNSLTIMKFPVYEEIYKCVFPEYTTGKLDISFASFNSKIILDFAFEVATRFTIDTLQIYKKIK
jgi:hypothetical protein